MSPPWATTSSRFCVVWAGAGVSAPGAVAAAPRAAAPLRSSRRDLDHHGLRQGLEGEPRKRHYIRLSRAVKRVATGDEGDRARDEKAYAVRTPLLQSPVICVTPASGPIVPDNPVLSVRIDMRSSTGRASPVGTSVARSISDAHCHETSRGSSPSS